MNATFPIISPLASLPTTPVRRLMDAGLYDNYGVVLLADWMLRHRETLLKETSGVALVEVRAFPLDAPGRKLDDSPWGTQLAAGPAAAASYPLLALFNGRGPMCVHRNNALLAGLAGAFRPPRHPGLLSDLPLRAGRGRLAELVPRRHGARGDRPGLGQGPAPGRGAERVGRPAVWVRRVRLRRDLVDCPFAHGRGRPRWRSTRRRRSGG